MNRYNKVISIEDFASPILAPHLDKIRFDETARFGISEPLTVPDSKQWECAMMLKTFSDHGVIKPRAMFAGIGAGTEQTTFALANEGCVTFPVDRYLDITPWSDVAPAPMMVRPEQYTKFQYNRGHVIPIHSDARVIALPDSFFDGVYSAGSIEHFGSLDAVAAAAEEIGRILKPGGIAALSTEFRLDGPNGRGWFDDNCILFTPELIRKYIVEPSGLIQIDDLQDTPSPMTYNSQVVLLDFLAKATKVKSAEDKKNAYPNLVLFHDGFLFCSVHIALRKPLEPTKAYYGPMSAKFDEDVIETRIATAGALTEQITNWRAQFGNSDNDVDNLADTVKLLEANVERLQKENSKLMLLETMLGAIIENAGAINIANILERNGLASPVIGWEVVDERSGSKIPTIIGDVKGDEVFSRGKEGVLCFGPYIGLPRGTYRTEFIISGLENGPFTITLDVVDEGKVIAVNEVKYNGNPQKDKKMGSASINFTLDHDAKSVECRLVVVKAGDIAVSKTKIQVRRIVPVER